jgi:YVTN family beta-propeller protein
LADTTNPHYFASVKMATGALLGLAFALAACGGSGGSPSPSSYLVAKMNVGQQPCAVEGGFGSIWVSLYGEDTELRIDPTTRKVLARIKAGDQPCGVAVGGGAVWVEDYGSNQVTRIDPQTNKPSAIQVGGAPYDVTFAAGAAWVTNYADGTVSRIDAKTHKVQTIRVGVTPVGVAPAAGAVWVTNKDDGTISRIDAATLKVTTTKVGQMPAWTAWGDGQLWIAQGSASEARIGVSAGQAGKVLQRASTGAIALDGDIVNGTVWVPDNSGELHAFDATTGNPLGHWRLGLTNPFVLAGYAGKLWVVDFKGTALEELDPTALR